MNTRLLIVLALWLPLAACGGQQARSASGPAAPPSSPAESASPSPSPSAPPDPVVVVRSPNGAVAATTPTGAALWSFDPKGLGIANPVLVTGGTDLFAYADGHVAVIDRAGRVIGNGVYTKHPALASYPTIYPAAGSPRWTWTTLDAMPGPGTTSTGPMTSSLWVAGVGEAPRRVRSWTGDYEVWAQQWSDAGIVILKLNSSCGRDPRSTALVDPATGAETALFGAGLWPLDVRAGVHVALGQDGHSVRVEGAGQLTTTLPILVQAAQVAPSGARLFVSMFSATGCGGPAKTATAVLEVPSGALKAIDGFYADGWLDDAHLLGRTLVNSTMEHLAWSTHLQVSDLSGTRSDLVLGSLIGVLRSTGSPASTRT